MLSTNHFLALGPYIASRSHDRIKVSTMSQSVEFLLGGRGRKPERSGEETRADQPQTEPDLACRRERS